MEWISVKDRLPDEYSRVVVYRLDCALICLGVAVYADKHFLFDGTLFSNRPVFESIADKRVHGITHWMPLSYPPSND